MSAASSRTLTGAVVLITGAGGGIGRALCAAFAEAGAHVVGSDIGERPGNATFDAWFRHDVTEPADWQRVVGEIRERFGRLDCLINNAGICPVDSLANTSLEQLRRVFGVNVESIFLGVQAALPLLRESGEQRPGGSSVVNLSSTAGVRGVAFCTAYCASKGAVTLLTKSAAKEFGALRYPIRVNSIHPGAVETGMMSAILTRFVEEGMAGSEAEQKAAFSRSALGRMAQPEEIAGAAVFLCSPAASFMTGAEIVIDGGVTA